jgi:hypothetical protein
MSAKVFLVSAALAVAALPGGLEPGAAALTPQQSAAASLASLRQIMDLYHDRFPVYGDVSSGGNHFQAWAKIPDNSAPVAINGSSVESPHSGATAIRNEYQSTSPFGGFYFLNGVLSGTAQVPQPNFGETPNAGFDLSGATTLTFWARGQAGGEKVSFFMGGVGRDPNTGQPTAPFPDSTPVVKQTFTLTTQWTQYSLDLTGKDLSYVLGGFGWVAAASDNPGGAVFFLDDIQYDLSPAAKVARLDLPRFVRSYATGPYQSQPAPVGDFDLRFRNMAFTYDNALALIAFLADGSPDSLRRARLIGDAFVYATQHDRSFDDGRLRDGYAAGDLVLPPGWTPNGRVGTVSIPGFFDEPNQTFVEVGQGGISTGNDAWALLALLGLFKATGDVRYLNAGLGLAAFIRTFRADTGTYQGFRGGLANPEAPTPTAVSYASTEHNLDVAAAFATLACLTGDSSWSADAAHAASFVAAMWDEARGCNLAGTLDPDIRNQLSGQLPSDTQSWAVLAQPDALVRHPGLLACVESHHRTADLGFSGVDFNDDKDGVWFEGTGHLAVAYAEARQTQAAADLQLTLRQAQATAPWGDANGTAAASHDGVSSGFDFVLFRRLHIGATAWNVFAQLGYNPFYARLVDPALSLFTLAPCRLVDTRNPAGPAGGPALQPSARRTFALAGLCNVPASARALSLNLSVVQPTAAGDLRLFPADRALPLASAINFGPGQTRTNNALVPLSSDACGALGVQLDSLGTTHLILDVNGYFQ